MKNFLYTLFYRFGSCLWKTGSFHFDILEFPRSFESIGLFTPDRGVPPTACWLESKISLLKELVFRHFSFECTLKPPNLGCWSVALFVAGSYPENDGRFVRGVHVSWDQVGCRNDTLKNFKDMVSLIWLFLHFYEFSKMTNASTVEVFFSKHELTWACEPTNTRTKANWFGELFTVFVSLAVCWVADLTA